MIPQIGKFYYINCVDNDEPEASYFGLGRCVESYNTNTSGEPIKPLYEFEHINTKGEMVLSVFYAEEIMMEAAKP